jgi:hypothetical protein
MRGDLGKHVGIFHGKGGNRYAIEEESSAYFQVATGTSPNPWPMILTGVDYEVAIYKANFR